MTNEWIVGRRRALAPAGAVLLLAAACSREGPGPNQPATVEPPNAPAAAPQAAPAAAPKSADAPQEETPTYELVPPYFDLGMLEPNERRDLEFRVVNRSDRPFTILMVTRECKCVTLDYDHGIIQPGESGWVKSRVNATSAGQRTTAAIVHLSDSMKSRPRIEFHYSIVPEVQFEPKKLDFGRAHSGKPEELTVRITLSLPDDVKEDPAIEPFLGHELPITLKLEPPTVTRRVAGMRDLVALLHVTLDAPDVVPKFETRLVVQPKSGRTFHGSSIPVAGEVIASWYWDRESVSFGTIDRDVEVVRTARLFYPGDEPPVIRDVDCSLQQITESHEIDAEKHCVVFTLKCLGTRPDKLQGTLSVDWDMSSQPAVLKVSGRVR